MRARQLQRRAEISQPGRAWTFSGAPGCAPATTAYRDAVLTTLTYLCQGGIYDHVGGGFARYSVDAEWLVPHFEKMLYDNGQLLSLLSSPIARRSGLCSGRESTRRSSWLIREMQLPGGGFASSLDADTEHEEGLTYVWSLDEFAAVLGGRFRELRRDLRCDAGGKLGRRRSS